VLLDELLEGTDDLARALAGFFREAGHEHLVLRYGIDHLLALALEGDDQLAQGGVGKRLDRRLRGVSSLLARQIGCDCIDETACQVPER